MYEEKKEKKKRLIRLCKLQVKVFYNLLLVEARERGQFHNYLNFFNMFSWWWWWFSHWVVSSSCDPMDCSLPGSSVHRILQARMEWVAISFTGKESFLTQWLNLCFLHCNRSSELQADSLQLSHQLLFSRQVYLTLCNSMDCSTPGFTISQSLLKLISFESVMPSNHLILCHSLLLLPSILLSIRVFSKWVMVEFSQNMNHWRREWQTTSVSLPQEPHEHYENEPPEGCANLHFNNGSEMI